MGDSSSDGKPARGSPPPRGLTRSSGFAIRSYRVKGFVIPLILAFQMPNSPLSDYKSARTGLRPRFPSPHRGGVRGAVVSHTESSPSAK